MNECEPLPAGAAVADEYFDLLASMLHDDPVVGRCRLALWNPR